VNLIAIFQQQLCEIGAILTCYARYQRSLRHFLSPFLPRLQPALSQTSTMLPGVAAVGCQFFKRHLARLNSDDNDWQ
jgi:hypothetical protein